MHTAMSQIMQTFIHVNVCVVLGIESLAIKTKPFSVPFVTVISVAVSHSKDGYFNERLYGA